MEISDYTLDTLPPIALTWGAIFLIAIIVDRIPKAFKNRIVSRIHQIDRRILFSLELAAMAATFFFCIRMTPLLCSPNPNDPPPYRSWQFYDPATRQMAIQVLVIIIAFIHGYWLQSWSERLRTFRNGLFPTR